MSPDPEGHPTNGRTWTNAEELVAKAKGFDITHLALELDAFDNLSRWPEFHHACEQGGIAPGAWYTGGGNIRWTPGNAYFTIAEDEGVDDYRGILDAIPRDLDDDMPRAIVTNFASYVGPTGQDDPELAKPLIDADFACITEVYMGDNPQATPENMAFRASRLGWANTQPGFGVWNKPWGDYSPWFNWNPGQWFYVAENFVR